MAGVYELVANPAAMFVKPYSTVVALFLLRDQFIGLYASFGPSNDTRVWVVLSPSIEAPEEGVGEVIEPFSTLDAMFEFESILWERETEDWTVRKF